MRKQIPNSLKTVTVLNKPIWRKISFRNQTFQILLYLFVFGTIGGLVVIFSHAVTGSASFDPEKGTLSGNVYSYDDSKASGGKAVKFEACPAGQSGTPPNCTSGTPTTFDGSTRPFSAISPFNTPAAANTTWFDHFILHNLNTPSNGDSRRHWYVLGPFGIYYAKNTDPVWTFNMPDYVAPDWNRHRPAQTFHVHAPENIAAGTDTDKVLIVIEGTTYYEVWNTTVNQQTHTVTSGPNLVGWATGDIVSGPGAGTIANNDGTRAANFSWAAGLLTGHDISSGKIDHATAIALPHDMLDGITNKGYIAPATGWDNGGANGPIKIGSRLGIPAGVAKPAGLSSLGSMLFDSLQKYGTYVGDFVGGQWPAFYIDKNTVNITDTEVLFAYWNHSGSADMEKIGPLLRVANYQP